MTTLAPTLEESPEESPIAIVQGQPLAQIPPDLYIPPDALEVILETFEGPLDLLLYLIKKQNLDILDIPVAQITVQYMQYVDIMKEFQLELAAEYLVMAALLAEIKSRLLLPRQASEDDEEADPRAELVKRLQAYEQFKQAAQDIDTLPRLERDIVWLKVMPPQTDRPQVLPDVSYQDLLSAFKEVMARAEKYAHHHIQREVLSIRERMGIVLTKLKTKQHLEFRQLFTVKEGRMGVVVTFIAILELVKQSMIEIVQTKAYSSIYVKAVGSDE